MNDILQTLEGPLSVACIIGVLALIGYASDEWAKRKERLKSNAEPSHGPSSGG